MTSLGRASAGSALWNGATFGVSKFVVLITTLILARLLAPEDFGLVAIGLVVIGYLEFVNDFGVSAAVIQRRDDSDHTASVAFWVNLAIGVVLTLLGVVTAPWLAAVFNEPQATSIIRVLSLSFIITSIGAIHAARVQRELRFKRRVIPETAKGVAKGAVSITLAVAGFGAWSLVWGQLAGALVAAVLYWRAFPWRPAPIFDRDTARGVLSFGSQMTLVGLLGGLHKNVDYLIVGRRLGARDLGLYTMAFRLPQLLIESIVNVTGQVIFPALASVQNERDRLRRALQRVLGATGLLVVPLGAGLALTADPFVRTFYGERWHAAIPVMQLLAVYTLAENVSKPCGDLYKAMGRPGILNRLGVVKLAVTVPLLVIAVSHGIVWVAAAQLAAAIVLTAIRFGLAARIVGVPLGDVLRPFAPSLRAGATMTAVCLAALFLLGDASPLARLAAVTVVGALTYAGTVLTLDRTLVGQLAGLLRRPSAPRVGASGRDELRTSKPHAAP